MSELATLGDVLLGIETGKSFQTTDRLARADELGVLKVSAVSWTAFRPDEAKAVVGHEPEAHHRVRKGDLLISRANTLELVGAVALVDRDYPNRLLSDKTLRLVLDTTRADATYLLYALRGYAARRHIELNATGTSDSMRNIAQSVIVSIPLGVLPSLEVQKSIAIDLSAKLLALEEARQAAKAQLAEIERLPARLLARISRKPPSSARCESTNLTICSGAGISRSTNSSQSITRNVW